MNYMDDVYLVTSRATFTMKDITVAQAQIVNRDQ